jgi:hypothetical protein
MNDDRAPRETQPQPNSAGKEKKRYQKPAFRHERVFETQALSCGKMVATQANCQFRTKTS